MARAPASARIGISGIGMVTSVGHGADASWRALAAGERGFAPVTLFDSAGQKASQVAEVRGVVSRNHAGWSRTSALGLAAAREAYGHARIPKDARVGLVVGGTTGGMFEAEELVRHWDAARVHELGATAALADIERVIERPLTPLLSHPSHRVAACIDEELGPFALVRTVASACSSGANALIIGAGWLLAGAVDFVIAGGSEGLCRLTLTGFNALGLVDPGACRPFDGKRAGLNLGEGAAFVVLERSDNAARRGAKVYADLAGWALGAEGFHTTQPEPNGATAARLMKTAMARAGLTAADIDYVNAHGTGTPQNDPMEAAALREALGAELPRVFVSSTKGQIGHTLGAAGAIEAAVTVLAIAHESVPPTGGLAEPDPACDLRHVIGKAAPCAVRAAISNSFGFGGMDTSLVFTKPGPQAFERRRTKVVVTAAVIARGDGIVEKPCLALRRVPFGQGLPYANRREAVVESGAPSEHGSDQDNAMPPCAPLPALDVDRARRMDRLGRMTTTAVIAALAEASVAEPKEVGLVMANNLGPLDETARYIRRVFDKGPRLANPMEFPNLVPSAPAAQASVYAKLQGPVIAIPEAHVGGEAAFAQALDLLGSGEASAILTGAVESHTGDLARAVRALFRREPALLMPSEGASAMLLETDEHARERGARALAEVEGVWTYAHGRYGAAPPAPPEGDALRISAYDTALCRELVESFGWNRVPEFAWSRPDPHHDAVGGWALALGARLVHEGLAARVLVVGGADARGYAVVFKRG